MGLFSKKPDPKEVKAFGRGKAVSGKAAEAWARQQADKKAALRAAKAIRDARKGK